MRVAFIACALALLAGIGGASAQPDRMREIDPLGGSWRPVRVGSLQVADPAKARLYFYGGAHFNSQAGCGSFEGRYRLDGARIQASLIEPVRTGKCPDAAAARLELALGRLMTQASSYSLLADGTLRIVARDGSFALFRRAVPAIPALAGRWVVERIGAHPIDPALGARIHFWDDWVTAVAGCNQLGAGVRPTATGFALQGGAATEMGCGPVREAFDRRFFAAMGKARRFRPLPGGGYRLEGDEPLVLRRPPPASTRLAGTFGACRSNPYNVGYDGVPALTFSGDRVRDSAGCSASYRVDGARLSLQPDSSPACAAPPESTWRDAYLEVGERKSLLAALRPDGFAFDEEGVLRLATHRGLFDMCREGERRPFGS
jgi:heat shock protein HslJ